MVGWFSSFIQCFLVQSLHHIKWRGETLFYRKNKKKEPLKKDNFRLVCSSLLVQSPFLYCIPPHWRVVCLSEGCSHVFAAKHDPGMFESINLEERKKVTPDPLLKKGVINDFRLIKNVCSESGTGLWSGTL